VEVADRVGTKGVALGVAPPTTLLAPLAGGWGGGGDAGMRGWDGDAGDAGGGEGLRPCRRGVILRELFMLSLPS